MYLSMQPQHPCGVAAWKGAEKMLIV